MKKIRDAIIAAETKAASDLEVLATVESEFAEAVKIKYLEHLDLNEALLERARLQERAKRLREYEEQRAKAAANLPDEQRVEAATHGAEQSANIPEPAAGAEQAETVYRLCFECMVTAAQAKELSDWLKARNIQFRRV